MEVAACPGPRSSQPKAHNSVFWSVRAVLWSISLLGTCASCEHSHPTCGWITSNLRSPTIFGIFEAVLGQCTRTVYAD
eukprot:s1261_g19.t1